MTSPKSKIIEEDCEEAFVKIFKTYVNFYAKIEKIILEKRGIDAKALLLFFLILMIFSSLAFRFFA